MHARPDLSSMEVLPRRSRFGTAIALSLSLLAQGCSRNGGTPPSAADAAVLVAEASGARKPPSFGDSPARQAVRKAYRQVIDPQYQQVVAIQKLYGRPELRSYLLLDESFIGGTFPKGTAALLREVHELESDYIAEVETLPGLLEHHLAEAGVPDDRRKALVDEMDGAFRKLKGPEISVLEAHRRFVAAAAELYELVAERPEAIQAKREGLEISDAGLLDRFNELVDDVNAARDAAEAALAAGGAGPAGSFGMGQGRAARR